MKYVYLIFFECYLVFLFFKPLPVFLEAPNKEAIVKHHERFGYKCDFIIEVDSTAYD